MSFKRLSIKAFALVAAAGFIVVNSVSVMAWGPERQTFTKASPAPFITFNSITDSDFGDERNFVIARAVSEGSDQWRDKIDVTKDDEFYVRVFVHNNAAENLNLVANNTRVYANVPVQNDYVTRVQIDAIVGATNATPKEVWDQVVFDSDVRFYLAYVPGSAMYCNNVNVSEGCAKLSDSLMTSAGSLIGYNSMDGNIPGCYQYSGYVLFKVKSTMESTKPEEPPEEPEEPYVPPELPVTGPGEVLMVGVVVAVAGVALTYWFRSRKLVKKMEYKAEGRDGDGDLKKAPKETSEKTSEKEEKKS